MNNESAAPPRLNTVNRQQLVLRTVDVERLIDDGHSARLIWELVERLDLSLYHGGEAGWPAEPRVTSAEDSLPGRIT